MMESVRNSVIDNADKYNERGRFTALIAFERTSSAGDGNLSNGLIFQPTTLKGRKYDRGYAERCVTWTTPTSSIGDTLLMANWQDPGFGPEQRAFYYLRVIEMPKPRWTAHDAKFFNVKMPEGTAMTVQDRADTSPIWHTPNRQGTRELA
jgi:hypothetical protein